MHHFYDFTFPRIEISTTHKPDHTWESAGGLIPIDFKNFSKTGLSIAVIEYSVNGKRGTSDSSSPSSSKTSFKDDSIQSRASFISVKNLSIEQKSFIAPCTSDEIICG